MNYDRPDLRDQLAAEYVLGTLRGPARRRLERLMRSNAAWSDAVDLWQRRLMPLAAGVTPVEPPAYVWDRIAAQLDMPSMPEVARRPPGRPSLWQSLSLWRALAGAAMAAALVLAIYVGTLQRVEVTPAQALAVLTDSAGKPVMVATREARGRALSLTVLVATPIASDKDYELWALPKDAAPKSLGLVRSTGVTSLRLSQDNAALLVVSPAMAISIEPKGGSPTGAPTGPVVFTGNIIKTGV
jgi:anti-sigma-K factor RskA